uniref:Immunoglobulin n=1 Tax=Echinococcus granulosus TaxID=6210 RepID=A0A068WRZ7_ECHGR|nr:Immunoglobulin [Echinococcus granulosus]
MTPWISCIMALILGSLSVCHCTTPSSPPPPLERELAMHQSTSQKSVNTQVVDPPNNHPDYRDDKGVTKVYFDNEAPLKINCTYPKTHRPVIWERTDLIYPLAVGTHIFSPDPRISVHYPHETLSQIMIVNATKDDAKRYRCQSSPQKPPKCASHMCVEKNEAFEQTFRAIYGIKPSTKMQAMASDASTLNVKSSVTISGPQMAFYGMPLELICRANFSSPEAKRDPLISLEWYHNGVRRRPSRVQSGGTFISSRWVDSNLLESRLLITWISELEAGRWNCVERSHINRRRLVNDPVPTPSMSFDQLNLQIMGLPEPELDEVETPPPLVAFATAATATNPEVIDQKFSKFRRYLHLTESASRWRKTSSLSLSSASISFSLPLFTLCNSLWYLLNVA